ncbi:MULTISPECIES: hypothetical protein [unclassified Coleofasciculus]|uniref:hypothetical protein n=1 Tax=Cyanophyceae TaxID=3028117 RepID=UPI001A7F01B1|nr:MULTISPECIES: hypothetical protein [unclassified Coleofasciculus]
MSNAGIPLCVIDAYSEHRDLSQISTYLEVRNAAMLSMLSLIVGQAGKVIYDDLKENPLLTQIDCSGLIEQDF